jgi:hypothetical protein
VHWSSDTCSSCAQHRDLHRRPLPYSLKSLLQFLNCGLLGIKRGKCVLYFAIPLVTEIWVLWHTYVHTHTYRHVRYLLNSLSGSRPLNSGTCVQFQGSLCVLCGGLRHTERGQTFGLRCQYYSTNAPCSFFIHIPPTPFDRIT